MQVAEEAYKSCVWELPDDYLSYLNFLKAVQRLDMKSSPGWPYVQTYRTNADVLGWNGVVCDEYRLNYVWYELQKYLEDPSDLTLSCFIKMEPHKIEKVLENRWRLIMASPLHVQLLWHMMFDYMNDLEIKETYNIPSKQGLVIPNGGWKTFLMQCKANGFDTGLDKRAWDWNVPYWLILLDLRFRYRMGRGRYMQEWLSLANKLYEAMFKNPIIMLSDGHMYKQLYGGIMKSGCVNTISTNSHLQIFIHILVCLMSGESIYPLPYAVGDDTLQKLLQAISLALYARFGAVVKSASDGLEFVGHEFTDKGPIPLYFAKHYAKCMHVKDELLPEYLDSMCRMYCKDKMYDFWSDLASDLNINVYSREYYEYWYDNEEVF